MKNSDMPAMPIVSAEGFPTVYAETLSEMAFESFL